MTIIYSSTLAFVLSATVSWASQVCSPEYCRDGKSSSQILAHDPSSSKYLTPGTYSDSSLSPSSSLLNTTHSSDTTIVSFPYTPVGFSKTVYKGSEDIWDSRYWTSHDWKSIYLPSTWYGVLEGGKVIWGGIPDKGQLPNDLTGLKLLKAGSSACDPPCSSHGVCLPSNTTTGGTCQCSTGWTGGSCDQCATGYWGVSCSPGPTNCTIWDDGLSGTGACLGTASSSASSCNCDHGTCTSSNQCVCSAGWTTDSIVSSNSCNICAEGFFGDSDGNCSACPLGCESCTLQQGTNSTATCTSCSNSLSLSTGSPATCSSTMGSCTDGTYYDESDASCKSCSPACSTCTGPSTSDCLSCTSPRVNLQGSCVYYDASTGICDSALSTLQGVYVVNLEKSECDACPSGCLDCHIPSFANVKGFNELQCSSCQEGYLLEDGRCVKKCNDGWFLPEGSAAKNGTCQKCDSTCSSCVSTSTTCTSCPSPLIASGGSCLSTCPTSTSPSNGTCLPCPADCSSCSSLTTCSSCPPSRPVLSNGRCIEYCPKDQYLDAAYGCQACDWRCSSCSANDHKSCTSCPNGHTLKKGECIVSTCGEGGSINGLEICLSDLIDESNSKFFGFFAFIVLFLVGGILSFWLYVRRERRKTREATREFSNKLDEREVQDKLRTLRLERVLGLERILTSTESSYINHNTSGAKGGGQNGYEEKRNKKFKELLLPSRRKKSNWENDIELKSTNFAPDKSSFGLGYGSQPPPPYVPSEISSPSTDLKVPPSMSNATLSGVPKRDSLDSIPTPTLPSFISSPIIKPTNPKPKIERKESNSTTILSMSSPISTEYQSKSLMPPPRPGMIRVNTQEREREKQLDRRINNREWENSEGKEGEEEEERSNYEFERRLRDLWPNLRRKDEGWI